MSDPAYPGGVPENLAGIHAAQAAYVLENFPDLGIFPLPPAGAPQIGDFFYRRGHLVARHEDLDRVLAAIRESGQSWPSAFSAVTQPVTGIAHIRLEPHPTGDVTAEHEALFAALEAAHGRLGPGIVAPDHLVFVTPATVCPATEPDFEPAGTAPYPPVSSSTCCTGEGIRVAVVDTGLVPDAPARHPWLHGVAGDDDLEVAEGASIVRYGGHGTFVASIVRAMAPRAEVRVFRLFDKVGAIYESGIVRELESVLAWEPHVISLSAGTHTWKHHGLLSFRAFVNGPLAARGDSTVLVAAAGNDGQDWKFAPAELPGVISVGALNSAWDGRAWFSNHGDWVHVYAPGQDLVHAFARGDYSYRERPASAEIDFAGMARWSGTSFSTPVVSGLIAARMSGMGENARSAADALLALAHENAMPGVGPVLLPGQACSHE